MLLNGALGIMKSQYRFQVLLCDALTSNQTYLLVYCVSNTNAMNAYSFGSEQETNT